MKTILIIFRWEISKLLSSWRKTVALFLLPAVLLMLALNIFPLLVNYMSTGSISHQPIYICNAPQSFLDYVENNADARVYKYNFLSIDEFKNSVNNNPDDFTKALKSGTCFIGFGSNKESDLSPSSFDNAVSAYYDEVAAGNEDAETSAYIEVTYYENSMTAQLQYEQFEQGVLTPYQDSLVETLGGDYAVVGSNIFEVDQFNPVTDILDFRSVANSAASRVVPGVLIIMMYYCVYSLASDMFASERDRGFLNKLFMTPVSAKKIFAGKILAINIIVSIATYLTATLLFLSSWINRSNDAMSLLPFGMLLTPAQLLIMIAIVPVTVFLMTALAINIIFSLEHMQEITVNLQLPLVLFLADFFIQMFRGTRPMTLEYILPLHNSLALMAETFNSQEKLWHVLFVILINIVIATLVLHCTYKKEGIK